MQTKIFIMAKKMESGGTEVALINLLNELVKNNNISITLGLLQKKGMYLDNIPKNVKVIEVLSKRQLSFLEKFNIKNAGIKEIYKVIKFKLISKIKKENTAQKYERILKEISKEEEQYDIAIDFHGYGYIGTVYMLEKIKAKRKAMFVHDEKIDWMEKVKKYIDQYDKIFCVSNACKEVVSNTYPEYKNKVDIFRNIINQDKIIKLSEEKIQDMDFNGIKLLTVGRLEYQKGYDLLIEIAQLLRNDRYDFKWYIVGQGSLYAKIQEEIKKRNLESYVILLGVKKNPYPYIKKCNVYIQPSRHEGYGIAIAEARILEKPIVATNLNCIQEQIINNQNGILCNFNAKEFCTKIEDLLSNKNLIEKIKENLKKENNSENNDIAKLLEEQL